jgi:preprotein translocase subunit SecY
VLRGFQNCLKIPDLRRRIIFTVSLLVVYRIGGQVTAPGIDVQVLQEFFAGAGNTLFGLYDMFVGGAFTRGTIFALGIMPYISASIILQLLGAVIPYFQKLQREGEEGRKKITQYTRYGTVVLAAGQSLGVSFFLEGIRGPVSGLPAVSDPGLGFMLSTVLTITTGTIFIMWLGEQITERGIGNGISLVIFAGIVASIPSAVTATTEFVREGELGILTVVLLLVGMVAIVGAVIFMERSQRRIPVQYAKRMVGRKVYGGQSSHLPLKINTAGVIPPIFASSVLIFPVTIAGFSEHLWAQTIADTLAPGSSIYNLAYVAMIIFFCYFYTAVVFNPTDVADNMKKYGGFVPGIRPGQRTAEYIDRVLSRITLGGAIYVAIICVIPNLLVSFFNVPFFFGGTALLIVVGVALDTVGQIETQIMMRNYDGFMKRGRIRGRRG